MTNLMIKEEPEPGWRVIGNSVRGASHIRAELPNQDAIGWWPEDGEGLPVILVVSDGHGSAKYFRSHRGAQLAVETALRILTEFLRGQSELPGDAPDATAAQDAPSDKQLDLSNISFISQIAEERLPKNLARAWLEAVKADIEKNPLDEEELLKLEKLDPQLAEAVKAKGVVTHLAYGATLLAVLVTETFILYLQLGDGDMLTVSDAEEVQRPIAEDERLMANETTSLCAKDAWADFRVTVQPTINSKPPAMILVSTDGYANSFRDEKSFLQVGPDLLGLIHKRGLESIGRMMDSWLNEASQIGSGDDITLGIIRHLSQRDPEQMLRRTREAHNRIDTSELRLQNHEQELKGHKSQLEQIHKQFKPLEGVLSRLDALGEDVNALQSKERQQQGVERLVSRLKWGVLAGFLLVMLGLGTDLLLHLTSHATINRSSESNIQQDKQAAGQSEATRSNESNQTADASTGESKKAGASDESDPVQPDAKHGRGRATQGNAHIRGTKPKRHK